MILKRGLVDVTSFSMATYLSFVLFGAVTLPSMIMFTNDIRDSNTAGHITVVANAADNYLKDKRDIILASATATTPYVLDVATLKSAGYLRNGFSEKNNLTQGYHIRIYQPINGTLHMMTFTTGGSDLTWDRAERVAQRIDNNSGKGGYISGTTAKGAQGAWSEALTAFGSYNPGDNHLVVANFYANMGATNDYLYRGTVAGHPEVNQMRTAIDMNANNINNAKEVTATGAVTTDEWFRTNGDTGWYSNKYGGGWHMTDDTWIRAYNGKSIMTDGQVKAGGRISTEEYLYTNKVEVAGTSCDKNGLIGRDASGGILSCQDRVWVNNMNVISSYLSSKIDQYGILNLGKHKFCALNYVVLITGDKEGCYVTKGGDPTGTYGTGYDRENWYLKGVHNGGFATCAASCFD